MSTPEHGRLSTFNRREAAAYDAQDMTDILHELRVALGLPEP